jgi:hypothetical protein
MSLGINQGKARMTTKVAFLGGARYSQPLDATSEKKWRLLSELGEMFVIGFSRDARPRRFTQHARFYLLPKFPLPSLRYLAMLTAGPALALWMIFRHGVRIFIAQSPYEGFAAAMAKVLARLAGFKVVLIVESHGDFEARFSFSDGCVAGPSTAGSCGERLALRFSMLTCCGLSRIRPEVNWKLVARKTDCPVSYMDRH